MAQLYCLPLCGRVSECKQDALLLGSHRCAQISVSSFEDRTSLITPTLCTLMHSHSIFSQGIVLCINEAMQAYMNEEDVPMVTELPASPGPGVGRHSSAADLKTDASAEEEENEREEEINERDEVCACVWMRVCARVWLDWCRWEWRAAFCEPSPTLSPVWAPSNRLCPFCEVAEWRSYLFESGCGWVGVRALHLTMTIVSTFST